MSFNTPTFLSGPLTTLKATPFTHQSTAIVAHSHSNTKTINSTPRRCSIHSSTQSTFINSTPIFQPTSSTNFSTTSISMVTEQPSGTSVVTQNRRRYLADFIVNGPVFKSAELSMRDISSRECTTDASDTCLDDWIEMASILEDALGKQSNDVRVYRYYLPVFFWILRELEVHEQRLFNSNNPRHRPFILGFSCPQGGGKTTMTTFMEVLLRTSGKNVQIASLDDFYLTNKEQQKVAETYPNNRLMQYRGMPGTHDLELMTSTLDSLRDGHDVSIPKYDKTAFGGRGDRAPKNKWKHISESTDVVLFEGWCLGFEPVDKENIDDSDLHVVNDALKEFGQLYNRLDGLFIIEIANMEWVFDWRLQAERGTRASGRPGLSDEQVIDFVSRFMPAYKQYSKPLYRRSTPLIPKHELHIEVDEQRRPVPRTWTRN